MSEATVGREAAEKVKSPRVPGEEGVWILVFGDLFVFAIFFATFAYYRGLEPAVFHASQATLNQPLGLLNTVLLLTSSWFVMKSVDAARKGAAKAARSWVLAGTVFGLGFVGVKAIEYSQKVAEGHVPTSNNFYMLYFAFTGIHLVHVMVGLGVLSFLRGRFSRTIGAQDAIAECCAIYWHMVDVLWVFLFAIFYLHG